MALLCYAPPYLLLVGLLGPQGMPGPQNGTGIPAVADWWLTMACEVAEENEAAAAPARTRQSAEMRIASFIVSNPLWIRIDRRLNSLHS